MGLDVFNLKAKISLDTKDYEKGIAESKSLFSKFGDGLKSAAGSIGSVLSDVAKGATVAIGAASTALTSITKQSLDAVASFEQLEGGVKTLFGDAAGKVMQFANEAYTEAGLSANQYMEQTIQFSASLIQGLEGDTEKAADIANMAITDMADNVNKMGTTMEAVQNAYRGLSRQNYMMLDNLALGYQGTASEMARLINDSKVMGDTFVATADNIKEISFDKYIEAIHVIQEQMGITGTTHEEAAETITGSVASMKAAWQNFLTGTGSAKQFTEVLDASMGNIKKNLKEIIPRLTTGLTELVDELSPFIPEIVEDTLPAIITGASSLISGLSAKLPDLITATLPSLADGVINVSTALVGVMPDLITSLKDSIPIVVNTIMSKKDDLLKTGKDILSAVFPSDPQTLEGIGSKATEVVGKFLTTLTNPENGKKIIDKGFEIIKSFAQGLTSQESLSNFFNDEYGAPKIIENLGENLVHFSTNLIDTAVDIIANVCGYLLNPENKEEIRNASEKILIALGEGFCDLVHVTYQDITDAMAKIAAEMVGEFDADATAAEMMGKLGKAILDYIMYDSMLSWLFGIGEMKWYLDTSQKMEEDQAYLDSLFMGSRERWDAMSPEERAKYSPNQEAYIPQSYGGEDAILAAQGMRSSGHIPTNMGEEYLMRYSGRTYDAPMYSDVPTIANTSYGDNVTNITINAPSGNAEDISNTLVATLDERMALFQAQNNRGFGYVGR